MASVAATHLCTLRVDLDMAAVSEIGPGPRGT